METYESVRDGKRYRVTAYRCPNVLPSAKHKPKPHHHRLHRVEEQIGETELPKLDSQLKSRLKAAVAVHGRKAVAEQANMTPLAVSQVLSIAVSPERIALLERVAHYFEALPAPSSQPLRRTGGPIGQEPTPPGAPTGPEPTPHGGPIGQEPTPPAGPIGPEPNPPSSPTGQEPTPHGETIGPEPTPHGGPIGQELNPPGGPTGQEPSPPGGPIGQEPSPDEWFEVPIGDQIRIEKEVDRALSLLLTMPRRVLRMTNDWISLYDQIREELIAIHLMQVRTRWPVDA